MTSPRLFRGLVLALFALELAACATAPRYSSDLQLAKTK